MGYITDYQVEAYGFKDQEQAEYFEFKIGKEIGYPVLCRIENEKLCFYLGEAKWYEWENDLKRLSKVFTNVTIDVEGNGEEDSDIWRARIRNGEIEVVKAEITFPDFKKLKDETIQELDLKP